MASKDAKPGELQFERSKELQRLFNQLLETWKHKHRAGLEELARRCGVSSSYLSHVGRYGRIPGKPVLILLAFNFELSTPQTLFDAAHLKDPWPYDEDLRLLRATNQQPGFVSLQINMEGLASAVRDIVRSELRPRTFKRGQHLHVGLNLGQSWVFDKDSHSRRTPPFRGLFPAVFELFSIALQSEITFESVHHSDYLARFQEGDLDLYAPVHISSARLVGALYTIPFCRTGIAALGRKKGSAKGEQPRLPQNIEDLRNPQCRIAVLQQSHVHDFAATQLGRSDETLIVCDTPEETLERLVLSGPARQADVMIVDAPIAIELARTYPKDFELLFATQDTLLGYADNVIAVRMDLPDLRAVINEALAFFTKQKVLSRLFAEHLPAEILPLVDLPSAPLDQYASHS